MQKWEIENKTIHETPVFKLRQFSSGDQTPVFVVPPHAGRHGSVAANMVKKCLEQSNTPVYTFELLSATQDTKNTSLSDFVNSIKTCVELMDTPIKLVGLCQAGVPCVSLTALYPELISKLAIHAAPLNPHADPENRITKACNESTWPLFKAIVEVNGGIQPGWVQWMNFALGSPYEVFFQRHFDEFLTIMDGATEKIKKMRRNRNWYDSPQDLAGVWYLEVVRDLFIRNKLIKNKLVINNRVVNLKDIICDVHLFAGMDDDITSPSQILIHKDLFGGDAYHYRFSDCGHTKVFTGKEELECFDRVFLRD